MSTMSLKEKIVKAVHDAEEEIESELYERWHIRLHRKAKHHVHRLRKKPDHHKDIIAFSVAFSVTAVVFLGWYLISFPKIIDSYKINQKESSAVILPENPFKIEQGIQYEENIQTQ